MNTNEKIILGIGLDILAGTGVGWLFAAPIAAAVGATGLLGATAATGTAISTLSGAALANASLAACGGGAVTAAGGGMAMGTLMVAGAAGSVGAALGGGTGAVSRKACMRASLIGTPIVRWPNLVCLLRQNRVRRPTGRDNSDQLLQTSSRQAR